jgi:hypothetical protein
MGYIDYPLDHVTPEGVKELGQAVNQFILWNRCEIFLDEPISPQKQRIQLSQTPMSSPMDHTLATPFGNKHLPLRNCHLHILSKKLCNSHFSHLQRTRKLHNSHFCRLQLQRSRKLCNCHLLLLRQKPQRTRKLHLYRLCPHPHHLLMTQSLYKTKTHSDPTN